MKNFYVFTGPPGAGKTTTLEALASRGLHTVPEAGRAILKEQSFLRAGAPLERQLYAELQLSRAAFDHARSASIDRFVIFDRSVVDIIAGMEMDGLSVPQHVRRAAKLYRYNDAVFFFPLWPEIYTNDKERRQRLDEAQATEAACRRAYLSAGYRLIDVPKTDVLQRVEWIASKLAGAGQVD
ncbi:MAG: ATP-binding protein [Pseudomonadota bacterium]